MIDDKLEQIKSYMAVQEAKKVIKEGKEAPDFELKTLDGTTRRLSDFKRKWIVLDFWGSWCGWCIRGIPSMKKAHEKHKDQMEIIGIACNDIDKKWREAVDKYSLPWTQLIDSDNKQQSVSVRYAVEGYPTKIVIDPQGIIKAIINGENPAFYPLLDTLLK